MSASSPNGWPNITYKRIFTKNAGMFSMLILVKIFLFSKERNMKAIKEPLELDKGVSAVQSRRNTAITLHGHSEWHFQNQPPSASLSHAL